MRAAGTWTIGALSAVLALGSCSDGTDRTVPDTVAPTSTSAAPRIDDGVLRIGVLLPGSGEGASIGRSARAAVRVATDEANRLGGVNGQNVLLYVRDEGGDATTAAVSLQQLLDAQVDVIIGPASSNVAIALEPKMVDAGVAACSPSASSMSLDSFPDRGLFFRTIPSDSLQAEAMAKVIEQTGATSAAIAYVDDGYGRPFEQALQAALRERDISVTDAVGFAVDDQEFTTEASRLVGTESPAIALIGDPAAGSRMLGALAEAAADEPRDIVLNDALRQPWELGLLNSVTNEIRVRITGVSPAVQTQSPGLLAEIAVQDPTATGLFATQAYDCANLFMLAAQASASTQPESMAVVIPDLSSGGSACVSFEQCSQLLDDGRNVDYDGPGSLSLSNSGDVSFALFERFGFDDAGRDVTTQTLAVS